MSSSHPRSLPLLSDLSLRDEAERTAARGVLAAARALRPALRDDQDDADARGIYSSAIHERMLSDRLYDITTPRQYGGLQLPLSVLMATVIEVATGNPGSGWAFALASQHTTTVAAHWPEAVQSEALGNGPFLSPHQFARPGDVRAVDGGYVINGDYPFTSGSPYSTHVMISAAVRDTTQYVTLLIPRDGYEILDDWHGAFGMKASGSNSVRFQNRFVPLDWAINGIGDDLTQLPVGIQIHQDALYLGRLDAYHPVGLAAVAVGTARAAMEEFVSALGSGSSRTTSSSKADDPIYQRTLGIAAALTNAAEALVYAAVDAYALAGRTQLDTGVPITRDDLVQIGGLGTSAIRMAESAVDAIFEHIGTTRIVDGTRMQRYFRDISTLRTHAHFNPGFVAVTHGAALLAR